MNNIQKNFKAKSALRHCADGGRVSGPGGPVADKVGPVMLSDKEYVLPADTVDAVGVEQLDALRAATHTPTGLRGKIPGLANGGMLREPLDLRNPLLRANTGGPLAPVKPVAPTVPGGNTLPAVRGPSAVIPNAPASGGVPPIKDVPGEVLNRQPRLPAPEAPVAAPKPSMLSTAGKMLGKGFAAYGAGDAIYDMTQNGVNADNTSDAVLNGMMLTKNPYAVGAGALGVAGKAAWGALPDDTKESVKSALSSAPGAGGEKPGFNPRQQYQIGTNDPAPEPVIGGGAYDAMSDRIVKDAVSRPAARVPDSPAAPAAPSAAGLGKTAIAPTTDYQRQALGELGVPESVQNGPALEQGPETLATAGKGDQFQNLGAYGGDANLYGRASDPSRPGRINDFVGVGAKATPQSALRGNTIPSDDWQVQRGRELLAQDAANPRRNKLYIGTADGELGSTEQRFGALRREIQQKFGGAGQEAQLARYMQDLNQNQSVAMAAEAATAQRGEEARLRSDTDRYVSDNTRDSYKYTADKTAETARGSALRTATKEARAGQLAADKLLSDNVKAVADMFATDETPASANFTVLSRLPQDMQDKLLNASGPEQREMLASILSTATAGRNMEEGRDTGATIQNSTLGALTLGAGPAARALVTGKGKPLTTALALAGAAGGAYFTPPKNKPSVLHSPLQVNSDGMPIEVQPTVTDGLRNGFYDMSGKMYIDQAGNLIDASKLKPDQLSAMIAAGKLAQMPQ